MNILAIWGQIQEAFLTVLSESGCRITTSWWWEQVVRISHAMRYVISSGHNNYAGSYWVTIISTSYMYCKPSLKFLWFFTYSCRVRVENAYLYLDTSHSQLTDGLTSGVVSSTSNDYFSIPPSTSRHVWGRVLTLGSCNVNVRRFQR